MSKKPEISLLETVSSDKSDTETVADKFQTFKFKVDLTNDKVELKKFTMGVNYPKEGYISKRDMHGGQRSSSLAKHLDQTKLSILTKSISPSKI